MIPRLLPEISHLENVGDKSVFVTVGGRIGVAFALPSIDLEARTATVLRASLQKLVEQLPDTVLLRVLTRVTSEGAVSGNNLRAEALQTLGYTKEQIVLSFEKNISGPSFGGLFQGLLGRPKSLSSAIDDLLSHVPIGLLETIGAKPLSPDQTKTWLDHGLSEVAKGRRSLDLGTSRMTAIRLWKQGTHPIGEETLASLKASLPCPFDISVTITKVAADEAHRRLHVKASQERASTHIAAQRRLEESENALQDTFLGGASLCEVEWILCLYRSTDKELQADVRECLKTLSVLGDCSHETVGLPGCLFAKSFGARQLRTFTEQDRVAWAFLPVFSRGESFSAQAANSSPRTLLLHRDDGTLHPYDHFNPNFLAFTALINGKPGSGKSALANMISQSLLADESITLIKVDVGGSYRKECSLFGGEQIDFSLEKPSGLNPFSMLNEIGRSKEAIHTLSEFVLSLIRDTGERALPKAVVFAVETAVSSYAEVERPNASFDDFLTISKNLPRREMLSRWALGGLFENVLKPVPLVSGSTAAQRYRYYNLENIQNAGNEDFAQGVMAGVIAQVNMEMIRAGDARTGNKRRLVFFADETPFFIQKNSRFFKFTVANFRKFGHGTLFIAQSLKDLEFPTETGEPDLGIIQNSSIRFLFQVDGDEEEFMRRFNLKSHHVERLKNLHHGREYRDFLLQDDSGERFCRLSMTPAEYWTTTSSKTDNEKFYDLRRAVPKLTDREAIACLSMTHGS